MKILLTGANGYIGQRLIPVLAEAGHDIVAMVRSPSRLHIAPHIKKRVQVYQGDLLNTSTLQDLPTDIDVAYYLVHSMSHNSENFQKQEEDCAHNFIKAMQRCNTKQIIYLGALVNDEHLSTHLSSRLGVETILKDGGIPYTVLRAGIIIGAGSASFEIMRDLVEKLPFMITPKWVSNQCQPIGVFDAIYYLVHVANEERCLNQIFDIGGPERISYLQMLKRLASYRKLKRSFVPVPVLTPNLSSYWLYFITSTNYSLAHALVQSLKNDAVCRDTLIQNIFDHKCLTLEQAFTRAFSRIEENAVISSWKDSIARSQLQPDLLEYVEVPQYGTLQDIKTIAFDHDPKKTIERLWRIGAKNGWYYMNWAWRIRGYLDKLVGGVGLRRGRTHPDRLRTGDVLDFWRVLLADKEHGHLLLYAEMRVPGEAWLEFVVEPSPDGGHQLRQTATFRPRGLLGRLYWYCMTPAHAFLFKGMAGAIVFAGND